MMHGCLSVQIPAHSAADRIISEAVGQVLFLSTRVSHTHCWACLTPLGHFSLRYLFSKQDRDISYWEKIEMAAYKLI